MAETGQIFSGIQLAFSIIIGLILLIVGLYFMTKKNKYTSTIKATTKSPTNCSNGYPMNGLMNYDCVVYFDYEVSGTKISDSFTSKTNIKYDLPGYKFPIYYNPENPSEWSITKDNNKVIGGALILAALFLVAVSGFWYWLTLKNKFAASAAGVQGVIGMFS